MCSYEVTYAMLLNISYMPQDAGHAFADVQWPAPLSLHSISKAHYTCQVIIIIIIIIIICVAM